MHAIAICQYSGGSVLSCFSVTIFVLLVLLLMYSMPKLLDKVHLRCMAPSLLLQTTSCSMCLDSKCQISNICCNMLQVNFPTAAAAPRRPPATNFYGKRAVPALLPAESGPDSQILFKYNPAFHRLGDPPMPYSKNIPFPFGPKPWLAEEAKPASSSQQREQCAAVPPHQKSRCMEVVDLRTPFKSRAHPGAAGAAEQQAADKV